MEFSQEHIVMVAGAVAFVIANWAAVANVLVLLLRDKWPAGANMIRKLSPFMAAMARPKLPEASKNVVELGRIYAGPEGTPLRDAIEVLAKEMAKVPAQAAPSDGGDSPPSVGGSAPGDGSKYGGSIATLALIIGCAFLGCGPSQHPCVGAYEKAGECPECSEEEIRARVKEVDATCEHMLLPSAEPAASAAPDGSGQ